MLITKKQLYPKKACYMKYVKTRNEERKILGIPIRHRKTALGIIEANVGPGS